ncbi:MAG: 6-pyruvoyl trahydropterin synthase family protein [bacterium]
MSYNISKKFKFECAHKLNNLDDNHPCSCIHGHSYKVEVIIFAKELNEQGFVIDFGKLKIFQKWLDDNFDHALILTNNDTSIDSLPNNQKYYIMPDSYNNTSAENFAHLFTYHILNELNIKAYNNSINMIFVKVWETENNYAGYSVKIKLDS